MSAVSVKNTTESDITIQVMTDAGLQTATIPGGRIDETTQKTVAGSAMVEEELIMLATKKHPVVAHYFDEGMLVTRMDRSAPDEDEKPSNKVKK